MIGGLIDVLVVGAGPTGLTLAVELAAFGVRARLIDRGLGGSSGAAGPAGRVDRLLHLRVLAAATADVGDRAYLITGVPFCPERRFAERSP